MFRRILVLLDGSTRAERALSSAAQVARASGGSAAHLSAALSAPAQGALHLARVLRLPAHYEYGQMDSVARARQQATSDANAYLPTVEQRLRQGDLAHLNVLVSLSVVVNTDVAQTLISMAEIGEDREDVEGFGGCDVIALATHGRDGLQRLVMGSVTERILLGTKLPLLIVLPQRRRRIARSEQAAEEEMGTGQQVLSPTLV